MYINEKERSLLAKLCYYGPAQSGRADLLQALYDHFAALVGEHTELDRQDFPAPVQLEASMGKEAADRLIEAAEIMFGAPYGQLMDSGTLVRFRTALAPLPGAYTRHIDAFAATGSAFYALLRRYTLKDADAVVFVADSREERREATLDAWNNLHESSFDGPIVLLVVHALDASELAEALDFDGPSFAVDNDFAGNLAAFEAAAMLATKTFVQGN